MDGTASVPLARSEELLIEEFGDELLVYDLKADHVHSLSSVAASVWRACDGETTTAALASRLNLDPAEISSALDELARCDLLARGTAAELPVSRNGRNGLSRREVTLRFARGAAAAASVPLIVSITAPTALAAGTGDCSKIGQCLGNCGQTGSGCKGVACKCCQLDQIKCSNKAGGPPFPRAAEIKFCAGVAATCPLEDDPTLCVDMTTPCPQATLRQGSSTGTEEPPTTGTEPSATGTEPSATPTAPEPPSTPTPEPAPTTPEPAPPVPEPPPTTPPPGTPTTPEPTTLETP